MNANQYKNKMVRTLRDVASVRAQIDAERELERYAAERGDGRSARDHAIKRVVLVEVLDEMLTPVFL